MGCSGRPALDGGASRFESGDRDSERGAGDVIESCVVEEVDGVRVTPVLATDADLQARVGCAPSLTAMRISRPTPSLSSVSKGEVAKIPWSR